MGWRHPGWVEPAEPCSEVASRPFSVAFHVAARDGHLWIQHRGWACSDMKDGATCEWTPLQPARELLLKGVSWSGFHDPSINCPEELGGFRYFTPTSEYLAVLREHDFNAVRLTLYARGVLDDPPLNANRCGRLAREHADDPVRSYMEALLVVVRELAQNGQFVVLDMHSLAGASNTPRWCDAPVCTAENEGVLTSAWRALAAALCVEPNVIVADLFNEPFGASWREWRDAAARLGDAVLSQCPRWLIGVQGVGQGGGECQAAAGAACWWGENVRGHAVLPVNLSLPDRLVLLPHTYGHGEQEYMADPHFPENMPAVWDALWGALPHITGTPVIVGEWGGKFGGKAELWQRRLLTYLRQRHISSFYYALNSNSFKVGGLYPYASDHGEERLSMLAAAPVTLVAQLQHAALCLAPAPRPPAPPPAPLRPPPSPPPSSSPPPSWPPCTPNCALLPSPWPTKCAYNPNCRGCDECSPRADDAACRPYCATIAVPWTTKCRYNPECKLCSQCPPPSPPIPPSLPPSPPLPYPRSPPPSPLAPPPLPPPCTSPPPPTSPPPSKEQRSSLSAVRAPPMRIQQVDSPSSLAPPPHHSQQSTSLAVSAGGPTAFLFPAAFGGLLLFVAVMAAAKCCSLSPYRLSPTVSCEDTPQPSAPSRRRRSKQRKRGEPPEVVHL